MEREREKNPYELFSRGDSLTIEQISLGSSIPFVRNLEIEETHSEGFYGKVLIIKDEPIVIKSTQPGDAWHDYWRWANWDYMPFPPQVNELDAQLHHLATKIIHKVIPVISGGKFYAPDSEGYTKLSTGFAQIVEKVGGRPVDLRKKGDYEAFKEAQRELYELASDLGFEQAGQIHPKNPFGLANIRFDEENNQFIWLDTLPAIPHRTFVKPFFHYEFHEDIKRKFKSKKSTFDKVHTAELMDQILNKSNLFTAKQLEDLRREIRLYVELREQKENQEPPTPDIKSAERAWKEVERNLMMDALHFVPDRLTDFGKIKDKEFRDGIILSGIEEARKRKLITEEEFTEAVQRYKSDPRYEVWGKLFAFYFVSSTVLNLAELASPLTLLFLEDKALAASLIIFMGEVFPSILRPLAAAITQAVTKVDLKTAAAVSVIPKAGGYLAIPAQIAATEGGKSNLILDFKLREVIAKLSKIDPAGGYGSETEAKIWKAGEKVVETAKKIFGKS